MPCSRTTAANARRTTKDEDLGGRPSHAEPYGGTKQGRISHDNYTCRRCRGVDRHRLNKRLRQLGPKSDTAAVGTAISRRHWRFRPTGVWPLPHQAGSAVARSTKQAARENEVVLSGEFWWLSTETTNPGPPSRAYPEFELQGLFRRLPGDWQLGATARVPGAAKGL